MTSINDDYFKAMCNAAATRTAAAARIGLNSWEREDMRQELMVDMLARQKGFDPTRGNAGTYTGRVSKHRVGELVNDLIKDRQHLIFPGAASASNDPDYAEPAEDWPVNVVPMWSDDRDLFADSDTLHDLQVALTHMSEEQLDLFRLLERHQDVPSAARAACSVGMSSATFYRRVYELRMHLRMFGIKAA